MSDLELLAAALDADDDAQMVRPSHLVGDGLAALALWVLILLAAFAVWGIGLPALAEAVAR